MKFPLIVLALGLAASLSAQSVDDVISLGPNYANQSFYSLADGEVANVSNTDWDIAFMTDAFNSSILINDNTGSELFLYSQDVSMWNTVDTAGMDFTNLYNSEFRWTEGAFIQPASEVDQFDYGWGAYNMVTHIVTGDRIFIIKLSDGSFKKVIIESLNLGTYTFKYADLDGSNEVQEMVNSSSYTDKNFWYYSMQTGEVIDREPVSTSWDISFTRYTSEIFPGANYIVSGALQNVGIQASEASPVAVEDAVWTDYEMSEDINVLGSDWKYFDMDIFQYVIEDSLSYFVQDQTGNVWKIVFTGFGGSATGDMEFTKEMISAVGLDEETTLDFSIFPNPSNGNVTVILPIENTEAYATLVDLRGQVMLQSTWNNGYQHSIDAYDLPVGVYLLQIEMEGRIAQQRLIIQ